MSTQTLTLQLPDILYRQLKARAAQTQRTVEDEALDVLVAAVPVADTLSAELDAAISALAVLDDGALWRAARSNMSASDAEELEELHFKRQREGLTEAEAQRASALVRHYERTMLVRAQAAALLKQRGHDVASLLAAP